MTESQVPKRDIADLVSLQQIFSPSSAAVNSVDDSGIDALVRAAKEYRTLREVARRAVAAWDCTALPHRDGMLQERMDDLRTACSLGRLGLTRDKHGPV